MSAFTDELLAFADRLQEDGYPTALIERAAERMKAMEELLIEAEAQAECRRQVK